MINSEDKLINERVNKFRTVFSNASDFKLNIDEKKLDDKCSLFIWSWNNLELFPDIYYHAQDNIHLILDGFISDYGRYGEAYADRSKNAKKLIELFISGKDFVQDLNGSFCIIIYDTMSKKFNLFNDRTSTRPIWYHRESGHFYASNFPSAIAVLRKETPKISEIGLWSLLATGRHTGETGLFEGIYNLPSGSNLRISDEGEFKKTKWFSLSYSPDYKLTTKQWGKRIAEELRVSAQRILKHYKDINLFLSGGMDSRVAAAAFGDKINSITLTTRKNMNSKVSGKVAKASGISHTTIYRDDYWYLNSFPSSALIGAGNYKISHAHFSPLFGRGNKYFNQTFTLGDLLENFNKHYYRASVELMNAESLVKNLNIFYSYSVKDYRKLEGLFQGNYGERIRTAWEEYAIEEAKKVEKVSEFKEDFADAFFRWQNNTMCPTYLMHENIRPYANLVNLMFDNDLLTTLFSIPHEIKSSGKLHNEILRNLNPKLLWIPNSNFWLPPIAPAFLNNYAKKIRPHIGKLRRSLVSKYQPKPKSQPYSQSQPKPQSQPLILTEGSWDMLHERYRRDINYGSELEAVIKNGVVENYDPDFIKDLLISFNRGAANVSNEIEHIYSVNKLLYLIK